MEPGKEKDLGFGNPSPGNFLHTIQRFLSFWDLALGVLGSWLVVPAIIVQLMVRITWSRSSQLESCMNKGLV